jgi:hypothetical protein
LSREIADRSRYGDRRSFTPWITPSLLVPAAARFARDKIALRTWRSIRDCSFASAADVFFVLSAVILLAPAVQVAFRRSSAAGPASLARRTPVTGVVSPPSPLAPRRCGKPAEFCLVAVDEQWVPNLKQ